MRRLIINSSARKFGLRICGIGTVLVLALVGPLGVSPAAASSSQLAGRVFTVAGAVDWTGPRVDRGFATAASFQEPAISVTPDGGFLLAEYNTVLRVHPNGRVTHAIPTSSRVAFGSAFDVFGPGGVAALPHGGFLLADSDGNRVLRVSRNGRISIVAGNGNDGYSGDNGPATQAELSGPEGVAALPRGGFLIADTGNNRIRKVWPDGHISTVAGNGRRGFRGDGGPAKRARLSPPGDVAVMPGGGFLIADSYNDRVRRVWPNHRISTVAGNGHYVATGDGGPATSAGLGAVSAVAPMPAGGFLIATDTDVRRVWPDGTISSVIAETNSVFSGDGGSASQAQLGDPGDSGAVAVLPDGSMLVGSGNTVRLIVGSAGTRLLAVAMRPLEAVSSPGAYSAPVVLTQPARLTIRIYRTVKSRPVATFHVWRPAGESTLTLHLGRNITAGLYGLDIRADHGAQVTRAESYAFLGGVATTRSIHAFAKLLLDEPFSHDPNIYLALGRCHGFSNQRVDCSYYGDESYVVATWLTDQGQLISRSYDSPIRHRHRVFLANPHWSGPAEWDELGAAWTASEFAF
jgi:hypothetical protein